MRRIFFILLALFALPLAADAVRTDMLVSTDWLAANPAKAVVLEVGSQDGYAAGHIPGARLLLTTELVVPRNGTPNELPAVDELEALFTRLGTGDRERIVLYSRDPILAARAWFTLDYLGHGRRASVLDGGLAKWTAEQRPVTADVPAFEPAPFHANVKPAAVSQFKAVKELVRFREVLGKDLVILDARAPEQFSGQEAGPDVYRAGHIPGAKNVPWGENLTAGEIARYLPERELRELYTKAGVTARSTNVLYCRTGMQAAVNYFALRYLGFEVTLFDGSYVEWTRDGSTQISGTR
jgi:thiosulfate/3-mercaptopyruvate sulfurtransferase